MNKAKVKCLATVRRRRGETPSEFTLKELEKAMSNEVRVSETVKEIPGFSRYLCDTAKGKVYRKPTEKRKGKWLRQKPNDIGYVKTTLKSDDDKFEMVFIHELVMSATIEFPMNWWKTKNLEIHHRNRVKHDNAFKNLQLVTKEKNHELISNRKPSRRLTKEEVIYIFNSFADWVGRKGDFYKKMASELGCVWQTIQYTVLGYSNSKVTKDN
ncbi:HNH endonuclease [Bacillus infantis]|uniref:HNH nuclease domain-containing protein n=1 Tax=Bacillus infantis TaxID=324767 RepID=A0A5D4R8A2_9BACI|nr:HNH endonuclease [Bacillus infantis]TYS46749.1 hypothetical protein FZD51_14855 [Bacillus infantis]